jgi:hypothetical protein
MLPQYKNLKGLTLVLTILLSTPLIAACATTNPQIVLAAVECAPYIPPEYRKQIIGAQPLPKGATVGLLADRLDEQTANLDRSQGRTSDVIGLVDTCDKRNKEILKEAFPDKPWYKFW